MILITNNKYLLFILFVAVAEYSCSNTKYLSGNQTLYTGAEIEIKTDARIKKGALKNKLEEVVRPEPNSRFLGIRPGLWFFNIAGTPKKEKGFRHWVKTKLGEPPVLLRDVDIEQNTKRISNMLYNNGYFEARVESDIRKTRKKKAEVVYTAKVEQPYIIDSIHYPTTPPPIAKIIQQTRDESLLEEGKTYHLETFKEERERLDKVLKNHGYFFFNPEYLVFKIDTTEGHKKLDVYLQIKPQTPAKALNVHKIEEVNIYANYSLERQKEFDTIEVQKINGCNYQACEGLHIRPQVVVDNVFLEKGSLYSQDAHNKTLNRLMTLGIFKFVNIRYDAIDSTNVGRLITHIYLTPMKKKSLHAEVKAVSKSNSFVGPGLDFRFRNRNAFHGAELFTLKLNSGFETQLGSFQNFNSYELGIDAELDFPRLVPPFNIFKPSGLYVPHTRLKSGYSILNRVQFFTLSSIYASAGFFWHANKYASHDLKPFYLNFMQLYNTTEAFQALLNENPQLRRSFDEQFILGPEYAFNFTTQPDQWRVNHLFFTLNLDFSGNIIYLAQSLIDNRWATPEDPFNYFGTAYSQYTRALASTVYYFNLDKSSKLATRLLIGIGAPYGNSSTLPYVKQFFIGGPNSLRAFRTRSLGPGTYAPSDVSPGRFQYDQAGDIKLEGNVEYRFDIVSVLEGALFADAGNIWLVDEDPSRPSAAFAFNNFIRELAVGTGFGLRVDVSYLVIRLDIAFPVRKPYLPEDERWVFDEIAPGQPAWRKENLLFNIAIGYPF